MEINNKRQDVYGVNGKKTDAKIALGLSWLTAAIIVLLPFHAFWTTWAGSNFGHYDGWKIWKEILLAAMLVPMAWLIWQNTRLRKWLTGSWIVRLYVVYILLHLALGFWALTHHQVNRTALAFALIVNLRFIGFFIFCAVLASLDGFLKDNWRKLLLIPASTVVAFGLLQEFLLPNGFLRHFGYGPDTIPAYQTVDKNIHFRRIISTLRGANPLGAYLALIIPTFLVVLRKSRILLGVSLAAAVAVLFFSYSRSAWAGAALSTGLAGGWLLVKKPRLRQLALAGILALIIVVAGILYQFRNSNTTQDILLHTSNNSTSQQSSNAAHLRALKSGAADIYHQPLGRGPGTAGPASVHNNHPTRIAENYYLQIGQEVGILGMLIFVAINALVAWELWLKRREPLAAILLVGLVGISFINLLSHAWTDDTLSYIWWGLAGIACAPVILDSRHKRNGQTKKTPA